MSGKSITRAFFLFVTLATTSLAQEENFSCTGTEPFWGFSYVDKVATYDVMMGERHTLEKVRLDTFYGMSMGAGFYMRGQSKDGKKLTVNVVRAKDCSDGMSEKVYNAYVTLDYNGEHVYYGCCRPITAGAKSDPVPVKKNDFDKTKQKAVPKKPNAIFEQKDGFHRLKPDR